jgi:dihydropteroate synthase
MKSQLKLKERNNLKARYLHLTSREEAVEALKSIQVDQGRIQEMLPKMIHMNIIIEEIEVTVANILKQEMISVGGDSAVGCGKSGNSITKTDVIVMGTLEHINRFVEKSARQSFELRLISERIVEIINSHFLDSVLLRTSRRTINLAERTLIMGILNLTPDSFSDGGRFTAPEKAIEEGIRMVGEGADMIDIGGESTRPGSEPVSLDEELRRTIPVVQGLAKRIDIPLSIDTMKAGVAYEAIAEGVEIVNDISSMRHDSDMAKVVANAGAAVILMHMRGTPKTMQAGDLSYRSLRSEIITFLQEHMENARVKGIEPDQIMVDPGLGFGKTAIDNLRLIKHLTELKVLGRPIVTGVSRKSFIGYFSGGSPHERLEGTAAAFTAAIMNGSRVIRVHDIAAMKKVAIMADALNKA